MPGAGPGGPTVPEAPENPERANVRRLIRWVAAFVAWPSLSIGLAFLVFTDPSTHWLHIAGLVPLGLAALVVFALAPRIAAHYVKAD